jgi:hypothetical protein
VSGLFCAQRRSGLGGNVFSGIQAMYFADAEKDAFCAVSESSKDNFPSGELLDALMLTADYDLKFCN